jgi:GTPase SAR1 family protein
LVGGHPAISLDYIEGKTLQETHVRQRQSLAENLQVAIAITTILDELHRQHVIHRNLASTHIIVSPPPLAVTLIGFGGALITKERGVPAETDLSYSMLAYISPEQTGRINRRVDHRADLYSLGAILYEVFTGKALFSVKDMSEWIYSHLARAPLPPYELNTELPKIVSDLILRLLAKNPDERYQSAFGVQADLKEMQHQLQQTGQIGEMTLGQSDYSNLFRLPDRLYDREIELATLKTAIRNAINGSGSFFLISGQAGSGKTALVEALRHYTTAQGVYFIMGTHESSQRHVPYTGLRHAFGELINLILTGSLQQLAQWKSDLLDISGGNGGLLLDMLPQLKLVIGQQPPAPELAPEQAHHRFHYLFRSFVLASSRQDLPLVLFLDNLQWADLATIQVLNMLLPGIDTLPIVIMAAYRNDEVGAGHPIAALIDPLNQQENKVQTLSLKSFAVETVNHIIAGALKTDTADTIHLAHLVQEKTGGNPLYIRQFIQSLYENGLLVFNAKKRIWNWKVDAIRLQPIISSVAEMMTHKIDKLPEPTRSVLAMAACIGT